MFEKIFGNDKIKEFFYNINLPSHAYMFIGKEGVGKLLFAKELANRWLCTENNKPCGKCNACIKYKNNSNMDFQIIEPDNDSIKVNQIRDLIKDTYEKPIIGDKKIYIINNANKMTVQAQNALLKILEEPPIYVIIILIGSNIYDFLNTIRSRCVIINFNDISDHDINRFLKENNIMLDFNLVKAANGSIGKAISIYNNLTIYRELEELILNMETFDEIKFIKKFNKIVTKENVDTILNYFMTRLFEIGKNNYKYILIVKEIEKTINRLNSNCNFEISIDNMIFNIYDILNKRSDL